MTEAFWQSSGGVAEEPTWMTENCEGIGPVRIAVLETEEVPTPIHRRSPMTRPMAILEMMRLTMAALVKRMTRQRTFSHLPA